MSDHYRAAILVGPERIQLSHLPVPELGDGDVLVRVMHASLCPTDLKKYYHLDQQSAELLSADHPVVLGHEASGIVERVGSGVSQVKPGDRVAIDPMLPCGKCTYCQNGDLPMCLNLSGIGASAGSIANAIELLEEQGIGGCFGELVKVPEENLFLLSDTIDLAAGALIEPLADVLHSIEVGSPQENDMAAVIGLGAMGLMHIRVLSHLGVKEIIGIEPLEERRKIADSFGATSTIDPTAVDIQKALSAYNQGSGPDLIFVCAGGEAQKSTTDLALKSVRKGGRVLLYASAARPAVIPIDINHIHYGKITLTGTVGFYHHHAEQALRLLEEGIVDAKSVRRPVFPLQEIQLAFTEYGKSDVIKVGIDIRNG